MSTPKLPFTDKAWKMPGYTGYIPGREETIGRTPIMGQLELCNPKEHTFLEARNAVCPHPGKRPIIQDPVKSQQNLWPCLQTSGAQEQVKVAGSNIEVGDKRVNPFGTTYSTDYDAPFENGRIIRSPLRNKQLKDVANLKDIYKSALYRVTEKRLNDMIAHMKERLAGKIGNTNDNAYKLRKLFKMYDYHGTGQIGIEDFRVMTEAFGMQMDDDALLALFSRYDPQATGVLEYHTLMKELLDADHYALYVGHLDSIAQETAESQKFHKALRAQMAAQSQKLRQVLTDLADIYGRVEQKDLIAACAACGVPLAGLQLDYMLATVDSESTNFIDLNLFVTAFL